MQRTLLALLAAGTIQCISGGASMRSSTDSNAALSPALSRDTLLVVSDADQADPAFALALADLHKDFYSVFGSPPVAVSELSRHGASPQAPAIVLGAAGRSLLDVHDRCVSASEAHCIVMQDAALIATGAIGSLGPIFAMYALSEAILGVVPLHHFADLPPARRRTIAVHQALRKEFVPSGWETRAVFINDEDLTAGFGADPLGDGIGAETYNRVYEALLRLKCNGVISGTANFADERGGTTLAVKRGLRVLQHHVTPVGLNVMRWPNAPIEGGATGYSGGGAPFSFLNSPAVLEHAWAASIAGLVGALPPGANASEDIVWTVGLRGLDDYAWWEDSHGDGRVANLTLRGEVIGAAMTKQLELLHNQLAAGNSVVEADAVDRRSDVQTEATCGSNWTSNSFWNHSKCSGGKCCDTYWGAQSPASCCAQCRATGIGSEPCAAWEWTAHAATCYVCTKVVLPFREAMAGHTTGCVKTAGRSTSKSHVTVAAPRSPDHAVVPRGAQKKAPTGHRVEALAYMWSEMLDLWKSGSLIVPEGVTIVFGDAGNGKIQGLDSVKPGDGLYYHVSDRGNQLTEWVSVSTILSELNAFWAKAKRGSGPASVFILNASDLKPYLLSLVRKTPFYSDFYIKRSIQQDRLRTNIEKG